MARLWFTILLCLLLGPTVSARTLVLNVATNGQDSWSGDLGFPSTSRDDGPLATLSAALKAVQAARQRLAGAFDGATILLHSGVYELPEPLLLTPDLSGIDAQHPLLITALPTEKEKPVISGGRHITGWRRSETQPGFWQVTLPDVAEGKWFFRQLFVNGQRKTRARTPNEGYFRIQGKSPEDKPIQLHFKPDDIKPSWATNGDVEVVGFLAWADIRMQIRSVDASNHVATLSGDPRPSNKENDAQYYVENAPDLLDRPGEWYLDRRTGVLTYFAEPGEDPNRAEIVAPRLGQLLRIEGDSATRQAVEHVVLRGLTFAHTDWALGENGYADVQGAFAVPAELDARWATDLVIEDCIFTHLGKYAIHLGRGCRQARVVRNEFRDLGAGGIRLGEPQPAPDPFDACQDHVVTDNHLYQLGRVFTSAIGVFVLQSGNNRIAHNHIHDLYYTAISVGWNWGYQETPCRQNIIEFNHLHDIGKFLLSDMGAIYTLGIQQGTVIRNNLIHDVNAFTYGGWGLYTDEGSSEIVLVSNVVYRCKSAGFHQHYGRENIVRNNIFAFNREHQLMRSREEDHLSFTFANNIVYFDSGDLLGSSWTNNHFRMENNVYFDARPEARPESMRFSGATLEEWRKRGHDTHSTVADPLFFNPRAYNFHLNPNSPALRLGFEPIDLRKVGIRRRGPRL